MNQFEFLRDMPLGQYLPLDSPIHRLDPRARLVGYTLALIALTLTGRLEGILLGLALVLLGLWVGRIPLRYAFRGVLTPLPFLVILALLQVFFNPHSHSSVILIEWGWLHITYADIAAGLKLLARFFALILGLGLMSFTLSTREMTSGLDRLLVPLARLGLPVQDFVMMVQITLRYLPLLALTAERIAKAQASRGADWDARGANLIARVRKVVPLIVPLFLSSLHKAENMALAMDSRAYGAAMVRSSMVEFRFAWSDGVFTAGCAALALLILIV